LVLPFRFEVKSSVSYGRMWSLNFEPRYTGRLGSGLGTGGQVHRLAVG
jgi:hypothetical protein